jgi:hypothetical protein
MNDLESACRHHADKLCTFKVEATATLDRLKADYDNGLTSRGFYAMRTKIDIDYSKLRTAALKELRVQFPDVDGSELGYALSEAVRNSNIRTGRIGLPEMEGPKPGDYNALPIKGTKGRYYSEK